MKTAVISVSILLALAMVLTYKAVSHAASSIKSAFSTSEKITETFRSNLEKVISTRGNILELAISEGDEYFKTENERRAFGGNLYLGTSTAEIDARCTFRYHLQLSDEWKLEVRSNLCVVHAPRFRPSLPVAIHTDTIRKHAESGWARFDKHELVDALEARMTGELAHRSVDGRHIQAVRETCRQSVADFVKTWLLREDHWRADRYSSIIVHFPDDPAPSQNGWQSSDTVPVIRLTQ